MFYRLSLLYLLIKNLVFIDFDYSANVPVYCALLGIDARPLESVHLYETSNKERTKQSNRRYTD